MIAWPPPFLPDLPGDSVALRLYDTASASLLPAAQRPEVGLYVCGITPYDATHLGHASTYVAFDLAIRALRDAGHEVTYVQNVTDVDEPLLERAARDGEDWRDLATREIDLFREDMTALAVIPPQHYIGVQEAMDIIVAFIRELAQAGVTYAVAADEGGADLYLDLAQVASFGAVSGWTREQMFEVFADRGGDPDREGKRDRLDPLLWRAARAGEPSWDDAVLGAGRPGWHVECTAISARYLGLPYDIQGGGSDLIFPHHEMSSAQAGGQYARIYAHAGMVGYDGAKMSKSKGNLVFVSSLRREGIDPMAIRLVLLAHHYRSDWEYTTADLDAAQARLGTWRDAVSVNEAPEADATVQAIREALANDLDAPAALAAVDAWASACLEAVQGETAVEASTGASAGVLSRALDALLGVRL